MFGIPTKPLFGVAGAIAGFFTVSRVGGNVPGGMIFDFVNKNNLL
jgi:hypothetical protein